MRIFLSVLSLLLFIASQVKADEPNPNPDLAEGPSGPCSVQDLFFATQCINEDLETLNATCVAAAAAVGWSTNCTECLVIANISALVAASTSDDIFTVTYPCVGDIVQESCTALGVLALNLEVEACVKAANTNNVTDPDLELLEAVINCNDATTVVSTDCRDCSSAAFFSQLFGLDDDNDDDDNYSPLNRFCINSTLPTSGCEAVSLEDAIVVLDGCGYGDGVQDEGNLVSMNCVTQGVIGVGGTECGECFYSQWMNVQYLDFQNVTNFTDLPDDDGFGWPMDVWNAMANCGAGAAPTPTAPTPTAPTPTAPTAPLTGGAAFFSVSVINVATTIAAVAVVGY